MAGIEVATGEHCKEKTPQGSPSNSSDLLNAKFGKDAIACCRDIYMDYHVSEIRSLPKATQYTWELGQKINEAIKHGI